MTGRNSLCRLCFIDQIQISICEFDDAILDDFAWRKSFKLELRTRIRHGYQVSRGERDTFFLESGR
jgi:hypothetical protein